MQFFSRTFLCTLLLILTLSTANGQGVKNSLNGLYGDFDIGGTAVKQGKSYQITARIVSHPKKANEGYLIVRADIQPGWDIYSITQPPGGPLATTIKVLENANFQLLGPFTASEKPHSEMNDIFEMIVESHVGTISWVAPIKVSPNISLENLTIAGTLSGQVCKEDACVPIMNEPFEARFSTEDASKEIAAVEAAHVEQDRDAAKPQQVEQAFQLENIRAEETVKVPGIGLALFYAFAGGLILNIMPCVLPVIGLKILSFFEQAGKNRWKAFVLNLWYTFGILFVFLVLAFLSEGLSTMFTSSTFGIVMCCLVFAMALSLMEVWELRAPVFLGMGKSAEMMRQEGGLGAFFKGIITTLLAIPCGAPLLSPALAWSYTQVQSGSHFNVFAAYLMIGIGMASPFLVFGAFPELLRFLPKPGLWMDTFKKIMGYTLLLAVIWILYFIPLETMVPTVALLFALWFGCWYIGRLPLTATTGTRLTSWGISAVVFLLTLVFSFPIVQSSFTLYGAMEKKLNRWAEKQFSEVDTSARTQSRKNEKHWTMFSMAKLETELAAGKTVMIDFTADWCLTCKWLERNVLTHHKLLAKIDELEIVTLQADWTNRDPEITALLKKLGGEQVPVVAVFRANDPLKPLILRGTYSVNVPLKLLEELERDRSPNLNLSSTP